MEIGGPRVVQDRHLRDVVVVPVGFFARGERTERVDFVFLDASGRVVSSARSCSRDTSTGDCADLRHVLFSSAGGEAPLLLGRDPRSVGAVEEGVNGRVAPLPVAFRDARHGCTRLETGPPDLPPNRFGLPAYWSLRGTFLFCGLPVPSEATFAEWSGALTLVEVHPAPQGARVAWRPDASTPDPAPPRRIDAERVVPEGDPQVGFVSLEETWAHASAADPGLRDFLAAHPRARPASTTEGPPSWITLDIAGMPGGPEIRRAQREIVVADPDARGGYRVVVEKRATGDVFGDAR